MVTRIGVINGSVRESSNTAGIIRWLEPIIRSALAPPTSSSVPEAETTGPIELDMIHLTQSPNHPLPIALGPVIPAAITSPPSYPDPRIVSWSRTASSWDAIIIVSPQYNWGIPGVLKNSLDHLYNEWRGKPVAVFTLGGHGGGKCAEQLRMVCGGGLKMRVVDKMVRVTLPGEYIRGDKRVQGKGEGEEWLGGYEGEVRELLEGLKGLMGEVGKRSHRES